MHSSDEMYYMNSDWPMLATSQVFFLIHSSPFGITMQNYFNASNITLKFYTINNFKRLSKVKCPKK